MHAARQQVDRNRTRRQLVRGFLACFGLLAVVMVTWSNRPGPKAAFDGGEMELLGVTKGLLHACPKAFPWERVRGLPAGLVQRLPSSGYPPGIPARVPSARVWIALSHAPPDSTEWYLVAEGPNAIAVRASAVSVTPVRGREILQVDFAAWPRAFRGCRLVAHRRIHRAWAAEPLGSIAFELPPVPSDLPLVPWAIPSTNSVAEEPWRVVIDQFEHGWRTDGFPVAETNLVPSASALRARLVSDDPDDRGWFLIAVRSATNAAGQVLKPEFHNWMSVRPGLILSPGPWPGEVWNLSLEFSRNSGFRPAELVPVPPIPVYNSGPRSVAWSTNVHGIQLDVLSITPPSGNSPEFELRVDASSVPLGWNVTLARVVDDVGADCWISPRGGSLNARRMSFRWRVRPGQLVVRPTLAVHRSRMVVVPLEPTPAR